MVSAPGCENELGWWVVCSDSDSMARPVGHSTHLYVLLRRVCCERVRPLQLFWFPPSALQLPESRLCALRI